MARVLVPGEPTWYEELQSVVYYSEADLERVIKQHATDLFPGYHVFPFKQSIPHRDTGAKRKPDLAMVRKDCTGWGIIEVELWEHDIDHVIDQTKCFVDGDYNAPIVAEYMHRQITTHCPHANADLPSLINLVQDERPLVVVIADGLADDWRDELQKIGVDLCVFEIFKSVDGQYIYRTFGPYPVVPVQQAHCKRHATLSNTIEIVGDFIFGAVNEDGSVEIAFDSRVTKWSLIEDNNVRFLRFLGKSNPISPNGTYGLLSDETGRCFFKAN